MKKLFLTLLLAAGLLVVGCDTIETTTITINLGGDRGTPPPGSVTTAHIAVFENSEGTGALLVTKSVPAAGTATLVVPAKMNLEIAVMAMNNSGDTFYYGVGYYDYKGMYGGEYKRVVTGPGLTDTNVVRVDISSRSIASTGTSIARITTYVDEGTGNEGLMLTYERPSGWLSNIYTPLRNMTMVYLERSTDGGPYQVVDKIDYNSFYDGFYYDGEMTTYYNDFVDYTVDPFPSKSVLYNYRLRCHIPVFGIAYYTWGTGEQNAGGI